jgi:hypothetical protein
VTLFGTGVAQALVKALLPRGSQTVVLRVQFRNGGKSSFSGTFAGKPLQGKFEKADAPIMKKLCPNGKHLNIGAGTSFTYAGKYNGTSYTFSGCFNDVLPASQMSFRMTGTIGSLPMSGSTVSLSVEGSTLTLPFKGKVGNQVVTGTATLKRTENMYIAILAARLTVST